MLDFLDGLSRKMHAELQNVPRLFGPPLPPELTLQEGKGSCRDLAVLFIASCRSLGLEARFVSGYIPAPLGERQHMHAWAEVRIPEIGWYPFDPTHADGVGEDHIPVAAAAAPVDASPIVGAFSSWNGGPARSEMSVELRVQVERNT
jgi:transglutaminase-like putative cysteine protease